MATESEVIAALEEHHARFRKEVRKVRADQLRYVRRLKRMTLAELREELYPEAGIGIPYWHIPCDSATSSQSPPPNATIGTHP
jgi:hypothetical protein